MYLQLSYLKKDSKNEKYSIKMLLEFIKIKHKFYLISLEVKSLLWQTGNMMQFEITSMNNNVRIIKERKMNERGWNAVVSGF